MSKELQKGQESSLQIMKQIVLIMMKINHHTSLKLFTLIKKKVILSNRLRKIWLRSNIFHQNQMIVIQASFYLFY